VYLLCEFLDFFYASSSTTVPNNAKERLEEKEEGDDGDGDDMRARALALCLLARTEILGAARLPACLPAARSRSHHAPAPRTKLTTDSRLLSLSQEPSAYENLSANQNKPIVHWIFGKVPNNFLV